MRFGEFDPDKSSLRKRDITQVRFFIEIQRSRFEVLQSLYDEVCIPFEDSLPLYSNKFDEIEKYAEDKVVEDWIRKNPDHKYGISPLFKEDVILKDFDARWQENLYWVIYNDADENCHPELIPIREAVLKWSLENNLNADWCRDIALRSINVWMGMYKGDELEWEYVISGRQTFINNPEEISIKPSADLPQWKPFEERRSEYLKRIEKEVRKIFSDNLTLSLSSEKSIQSVLKPILSKAKSYCDVLTNYYHQKGYPKIPISREKEKFTQWAVMAQVGKNPMSFIGIARELASQYQLGSTVDPNDSHVRREVVAILEEIELPVRPGLKK